MTFLCQMTEFGCFFHYSRVSLICLICFNLPNLYFYTIRSMTMFLKVLNKVNFKAPTKSWLFLIADLLLFAKLLKLLVINHSSSKRRIIFVPWLLKFSHAPTVLQLAWVCTSAQLSWITQSSLASFSEYQGSCGIVPNGPASLVFSFNIRQGLKC